MISSVSLAPSSATCWKTSGRSGPAERLDLRLPDELTAIYKGARECESHMLLCSTGAPQGTVLAPFPFTFYTSDVMYSTPTCHLQKFPDDSVIVAPTELPPDQRGEAGGGSL